MKKIILSLFFYTLFFQNIAFGNHISLIQDTEIEEVLTNYAQQVFKAAGLPPQQAKVAVVNDDELNAFVAGGKTIFVHTGLITQSQNVDDLMFVLSHETGHIVGGHITRGIGAYEQAKTTALISTILGGLVAVAGRPDAGIAVMMGGNSSASGIYTAYRQTEESAADRIAVDIMKKTNYSMSGFINTMKLIKMQDRLTPQGEWSYLRTHPLSQDRVNALERFIHNPTPSKKDARFDLIKAKLIGFLYPPERVFNIYQNQKTIPAFYATAIALYKNRQFPESIKYIDRLIEAKPTYPYFYELKGQFMLETGQIDQAIIYYNKALKYIKSAPLMRLSLAQALLEKQDEPSANRAIDELKIVLSKNPRIPFAWQLLMTAYDLTGQQKYIPYAMAELNLLRGDKKKAHQMAKKALNTLPKDSPEYHKAEDILSLTKTDK